MKNKILKFIIILLLTSLLTGCWNYVGVDEITIVTGIAIDKNKETDEYIVSYEIISLSESSKQQELTQTSFIESSGVTLFDAFRNSKKRAMNKLYFSDAQAIIISKEVAKKDGINSIIDVFIRDGEIRETINLAISAEETAKELFLDKGIDTNIVGFELKKIITSDNRVTSSTKNVELFKTFNLLKGEGNSLALPLFHTVKNKDEKTVEIDGIAIFDKDKLIGNLNPEESKMYLFINNEVDGGVIPIDANNDGKYDSSLEISKNRTSRQWSYKDKKIKFKIKILTDVYLSEYNNVEVNPKKISNIEKKAEKVLVDNMDKLISKAKTEFKIDIFGFGNLVYKKDNQLWKKIKKDWNKLFSESEIEVETDVRILNTALSR
ncbi:MAG: Ger(x)C family spore germination protein [Bacilli bacterium]|nr:Ger(x)C family spore germination protein [Bacilli bacterium]MDD4607678.1 Ger(x)C family spore germination protein [Bacilli bacterium]